MHKKLTLGPNMKTGPISVISLFWKKPSGKFPSDDSILIQALENGDCIISLDTNDFLNGVKVLSLSVTAKSRDRKTNSRNSGIIHTQKKKVGQIRMITR